MNSTAERHTATSLLDHADRVRRTVAPKITRKHKSQLGQFMTPAPVARFMASLFPASDLEKCTLLDAGAGVGALTCAFLDRWTEGKGFRFQSAEIKAYEIDPILHTHLEETFSEYAAHLPLTVRVLSGDFIYEAAMQRMIAGKITHAILNPPYKKISSDSAHRLILRQAGIETVNLYTAFVALALSLMKSGGQLVAIIPRSFCNGPYYRPFREFLLRHAALRHMHLFASRSEAFKDDDVLQENIIVHLERGGAQGGVTVSNSTDDSFSDLVTHEYSFDRIVFPDDPEIFIHVPTSPERNEIEFCRGVSSSLADIGIGVSTGPVVDFRLLKHIQQQPVEGGVPLLYPGHFAGGLMHWPKVGIKRGNIIMRNGETEKWLFPNGFYTVVRRFSSKEEPRRIIASVVRPDTFPEFTMLGFENHLNVFHQNKNGLPEAIAYGLAAFLNTTAVDDNFRRFNGHTQVNATDLRSIKYPDRKTLAALGQWAQSNDPLSQGMMDEQLRRLAG